MLPPPPTPTLFPYTTLFRSRGGRALLRIPLHQSADRRGEGPGGVVQPSVEHGPGGGRHARGLMRSEEHTSELQSRRDLVCRLLLEKKKHTPARSDPRLRGPR